jgi:outer membrane protein OmpA-like peptidoglycan-associated protein
MVALNPKPVYGVKGILTRASGNIPVPSVSLFIHSPDSKTDTTRTENDGSFKVKLNPYSNYYLVFYKPGYFPSGLSYSTSGRDTGYVDLNQLTGLDLEPALTGKSYLLNISYEQNSLDTANGSQLLLDAVSKLLKDNESWTIEIGVHTSSRGDAETNLHNSRQRAQSVAAYLENAGIDSSRISAKGFGEQQLINDCADGVPCTDEENEENERTEITILNR